MYWLALPSVGTSVTLMQAQEAENRKLRSDLQTKDEEIVSLQRELANLRSTTDQRVRDFECEIESLHSRLQANEMRTIALENENGRMVETVQVHLVLRFHSRTRTPQVAVCFLKTA